MKMFLLFTSIGKLFSFNKLMLFYSW